MQRTKNTTKRALHHSMNGIKDHAAGMGGSVRDLGEAVKDVLIEKLTDMLKRAVTLGNKGTSAVREAAVEAKDEVEERIQDRPYQAVLLAAGIGLVLGLVLHRRS
jgi:ElaB/YqjD/DUF883 family membrane-anchored ribosome-binding protein